MDVYGYTPYQFNESDELAKQMYAQQALASPMPYPRQGIDPQNLSLPSGIPWTSRGLPWGLQSPPQVVQFTANSFKDGKFHTALHCKRKSMDVEPVIPAKQLITEEKMAAHLNGLHISSQYTAHDLASDDVTMDTGVTPQMINTEKLKGHTIVLSEEIKKLHKEDIIPTAIMERLEKPSMSLVVWKPRESILEKIKEQDEKAKEDDTYPKKRNGVLVPDDMDIGINDVEM